MILATLSAYVVLQQTAEPTAAELISKCFAIYTNAKTMAGRIVFTNSAKNVQVKILTELQLERPNKIFLRQTKSGTAPQSWLVTSDGNQFSYDRPEGKLGPARYLENLHLTDRHRELELSDIYAAVLESIGDKNMPLDVAIGRKVDLRFLVNQWPSFKLQGKVKMNNIDCYAIVGSYRENAANPVSGAFELYLKENGEIVRYLIKQNMQFDIAPSNLSNNKISTESIEVISMWDCELQLNVSMNTALFQVIK